MVASRLLSVNVGTLRTVPGQGRQVRTAVFEDPSPGPRFVGPINIEGDDQGRAPTSTASAG